MKAMISGINCYNNDFFSSVAEDCFSHKPKYINECFASIELDDESPTVAQGLGELLIAGFTVTVED